MSSELANRVCTPCRGGVPPLTPEEAERLRASTPEWELADGATRLRRTFKHGSFAESLAFANRVGELAEAEGHHPVVTFGWGFCTVELQTKKIKGLHENDFIMAAKIDALAS